jgi:hypothetical protein
MWSYTTGRATTGADQGSFTPAVVAAARRMESQEEEDGESMDPVFNLRGFFIRM